MSNTNLDCFINRFNGWERALPHHKNALESFLNKKIYDVNECVQISVPYKDGGEFISKFLNINVEKAIGVQIMSLPMRAFDKDGGNVQSMAVYIDSRIGEFVEIMMANPQYMDNLKYNFDKMEYE